MSSSKANIQVVDATALSHSLNDLLDSDIEVSLDDELLTFYIYRYTMDANGYHIGYEHFEGSLKLYNKDDFGVYVGAPSIVSPFFVFPSQLNAKVVSTPQAGEDYFPPDKQIVYQEVEEVLNNAISTIPNWDFNFSSRASGLPIKDCWVLRYVEDDFE